MDEGTADEGAEVEDAEEEGAEEGKDADSASTVDEDKAEEGNGSEVSRRGHPSLSLMTSGSWYTWSSRSATLRRRGSRETTYIRSFC